MYRPSISRTLKRDLTILAWNFNGVAKNVSGLQELVVLLKPDELFLNANHVIGEAVLIGQFRVLSI